MNCPECDALLHGDKCRSCGWALKTEPRKVTAWEPPPFVPPSPEEQAEVRRLIAQTAAKLGVSVETIRPRAVERMPRCPKCAMGKFVHMGVRFCLDCYNRLPGA